MRDTIQRGCAGPCKLHIREYLGAVASLVPCVCASMVVPTAMALRQPYELCNLSVLGYCENRIERRCVICSMLQAHRLRCCKPLGPLVDLSQPQNPALETIILITES